MEQCLVCFSSFIINWDGNGAGCSQGGYETLWDCFTDVMLCCMFKRDTEQPSCYHLCRDGQAYWCVCYVPYMHPWCVDFSFKADSSSGSHLRARDEPSSNHIRHGEAITAGPFLVMVCSSNDRPTGCVRSGCVCLLSFVAIPVHR